MNEGLGHWCWVDGMRGEMLTLLTALHKSCPYSEFADTHWSERSSPRAWCHSCWLSVWCYTPFGPQPFAMISCSQESTLSDQWAPHRPEKILLPPKVRLHCLFLRWNSKYKFKYILNSAFGSFLPNGCWQKWPCSCLHLDWMGKAETQCQPQQGLNSVHRSARLPKTGKWK